MATSVDHVVRVDVRAADPRARVRSTYARSTSDDIMLLDRFSAHPMLHKMVMQYLFPCWGVRLRIGDDVALYGADSTIARVVAVDDTTNEVRNLPRCEPVCFFHV